MVKLKQMSKFAGVNYRILIDILLMSIQKAEAGVENVCTENRFTEEEV